MKLADISGTKRKNIWKLKLGNLKLTASPRVSETCVGASVTLKTATGLVLTLWY